MKQRTDLEGQPKRRPNSGADLEGQSERRPAVVRSGELVSLPPKGLHRDDESLDVRVEERQIWEWVFVRDSERKKTIWNTHQSWIC